ncbi:MAG: serine/threonine protein kinase [Myxococcales bacterium]|nr:serine/threonine protein kinase [Myxococcales bacterium]
MELKPGITIGNGKYQLTGRLREGGQAEVWEAHQMGMADFSKDVVLKCVRVEGDNEIDMQQALLREARLAARLQHPNIVEIYDIGEEQDLVYIAMERIQGLDLEMLLQQCQHKGKTAFPWYVAATVMLEVCKGLHYAHSHTDRDGTPLHLVHRDLKPSNILLTSVGYVKVIDFGIAKATNVPSSGDETSAGRIKGTPAYMSPEQVLSRPLDARSDLFALGSILYELCCGYRAFDSEDVFSIMMLVSQGQPEPLGRWVPELPPELEELIFRLLAKDPNERLQNAREVQRALDKILRKYDQFVDQEDLAGFYKSATVEDDDDLGALVESLAAQREQGALDTDPRGADHSTTTENSALPDGGAAKVSSPPPAPPSPSPDLLPDIAGLLPDDAPEDKTVAVIRAEPLLAAAGILMAEGVHGDATSLSEDISLVDFLDDVEPTLANKARSQARKEASEPPPVVTNGASHDGDVLWASSQTGSRHVPVASSRTQVVEPSEELRAIQQADKLAKEASPSVPSNGALASLPPSLGPSSASSEALSMAHPATSSQVALQQVRPNRLRLWGTLLVLFLVLAGTFLAVWFFLSKPKNTEIDNGEPQVLRMTPPENSTNHTPPTDAKVERPAVPVRLPAVPQGPHGTLRLDISPPCLLSLNKERIGYTDQVGEMKLAPGSHRFLCSSVVHGRLLFSVQIEAQKQTVYSKKVPVGRLFISSQPPVWVYAVQHQVSARLGPSQKALIVRAGKQNFCFLQKQDVTKRQCKELTIQPSSQLRLELSW